MHMTVKNNEIIQMLHNKSRPVARGVGGMGYGWVRKCLKWITLLVQSVQNGPKF